MSSLVFLCETLVLVIVYHRLLLPAFDVLED